MSLDPHFSHSMRVDLAGMFDPDVCVAQGDPRAEWDEPLPGEEAAITRASALRRREFLAGRALARQAMRGLDFASQPIPAGDDRAPVWPAGMTGSISHCEDWCVAAAARVEDGYLSIGLDIEPALPLDPDLIEDVCTPEECGWLALQPASLRNVLARAMFSAKECAYKCQYPLSRTLLDFQAMSIRLDQAASTFVARFEVDVAPFEQGDELRGRLSIGNGYIVTGVALKHGCRR